MLDAVIFLNTHARRDVAFTSAGVDLSKPIVAMCGGGMVSPLVTFALSRVDVTAAIYDVSQRCIIR